MNMKIIMNNIAHNNLNVSAHSIGLQLKRSVAIITGLFIFQKLSYSDYINVAWFLADPSATQYDRLLALIILSLSVVRPSVCL